MVMESNWGESHTGPNRPPETLRGVSIFSVEIHPVRWRSPWKVRTSYWALAAKTQGPNSQPANRKLRSIARLVYTSTVASVRCLTLSSHPSAQIRYTFGHGGGYVHSSSQEAHQIQTHSRRRRRAPAPRVWVRQYFRFRPLSPPRRFPQRRPRGLPRRLPLAPPPRYRDHHVCARGNRRTRRQPRQPRRHRRRRRTVDDRRQRHHPPGNAQGRPRRPHARLPVVGQSSVIAQDDCAALPGGESTRDPSGEG